LIEPFQTKRAGDEPPIKEPMFNFAEPAPVYLIGSFIAVHLLMSIAPSWLESFAGKYAILHVWGRLGLTYAEQIPSLVLHGFLHGGWMHLISNSFMIIALGIASIRGAKLLSIRKGRPRSGVSVFFILFFAGVILGGLAQWLYWYISGAALGVSAPRAIGASGGASALFAAGGWALGGAKQMFKFALAWGFINLLMVLAEAYTGIRLAWAAHLGGFAAGMILAPRLVEAQATRFKVLR